VTSNTSWSWKSNANWLTSTEAPDQSGDQDFSYTVAENASTSPRTGTITFTSSVGGLTKTLTVNQAGAAALTSISPASKSTASAGGSYTIAVTSNTNWTVASNQTWATVSPGSGSMNGTVTVTVAANTATSQRTATITIGGETHKLTQAAAIVAPDNDGDGIPDSTDPDDDNDGVADVDDDFPLDPTKVYGVITREDGINIQGDQASSPTSRKVRFRKSASGDDYSGFLASADGRKILGRFEGIVLKETRDFSARMIFGNTNYALKGRINKKGRYSKVITPEKGKDVTVNLRLVKTESGNYKLRGTVQRGKKTAVVVVVKSGQVDSLAGRYTLLIPGEEAASTKPQGHGYGAMQVMSGGTAKLTGLLGDGSKWTAECNVTSDGEMPLFSTLYLDDKGWVGGLVSFRDIEGVSDCDGTVHWRKPGNKKNRFSLVRDLIGSRYKRERVIAGDPATKPNVMADVGAGDGDASQAWELAWNAGNKKRLVYTGSGGAKLIVRRKKGLTEFYLTDPQLGQTKVGDGVVFQKQDIAAGTYHAQGKTQRSLVITPVE
jgi:hypothetical protein